MPFDFTVGLLSFERIKLIELMTTGEFFSASSYALWRSLLDLPGRLDMTSWPLMRGKISFATARAVSVFPVLGA